MKRHMPNFTGDFKRAFSLIDEKKVGGQSPSQGRSSKTIRKERGTRRGNTEGSRTPIESVQG